MATLPDRLRRLPSPRLPQDRRGRPARPDPAAAAAAGGAGRPTADAGQGARPTPSSWSGWPAARPPSTCGTSSPNAPEGIRGEFKPIATKRRRRPDQRAPAEDGPGRWTRSPSSARWHHTIPSHGPATVFMTTGNKPTPALQYPSLGSLATQAAAGRRGRAALRHASASCAAARPAAPATSARPTTRSSSRAARRRQGRQGAAATCASAASRCRPASRSKSWRTATSCSSGFDETFRDARQGRPTWSTASTPSTSRRWKSCAPTRPRRRSTWTRSRKRLRERYGADAVRPGRAGGPAAGRGGVRFVTVSLGGWDTHGQNFHALQGQAAAAARPDAVGPDRGPGRPRHARHARSSTAPASSAARRRSTRTPAAITGRGRWRWSWPAAASSAATPTARTDAQGMAPATEPCTPDDVSATIFHCLGIDPHHGAADADGPADPAVPRGQGDREADVLSRPEGAAENSQGREP